MSSGTKLAGDSSVDCCELFVNCYPLRFVGKFQMLTVQRGGDSRQLAELAVRFSAHFFLFFLGDAAVQARVEISLTELRRRLFRFNREENFEEEMDFRKMQRQRRHEQFRNSQ